MVSKQRLTNAGMAAVAVMLIATSIYISFASTQTTGTTAAAAAAEHTLIVSGTGTATIAPDKVQITFGAVTRGASAQEASAANSKIINAVLAQLNSIGISGQSIATVSFNIWPTYDYGQAGNQQTITGYQTQHDLQVTVTDSNLTRLGSVTGQIIDLATGAGANQIYGIQFMASDPTQKQLSGQALQLAIGDASSRAQVMASSLGVKIVGVQSATESSPFAPPIYYASVQSPVADKGTPVQPGTFSLTATVQVTYLIQ